MNYIGVMKLISANGDHGQIVQLHVVKESKQGQEHVRMMLRILASHSMSKESASFLQLIGSHGQVVQQHAGLAVKQDQEHAHTIQETLANRSLNKRVVTFKNAAMTLGQHGVHGTHAPNVGLVFSNVNVRDVNSSKYRRVHRMVKR